MRSFVALCVFVVLLGLVYGEREQQNARPAPWRVEDFVGVNPVRSKNEQMLDDIVARVRHEDQAPSAPEAKPMSQADRNLSPEYNWNLWRNSSMDEYRHAYGGKLVNPHCYVPQGRKTCAPHFLIAGSMKCGTTSLHSYLLQHPQVMPLRPGAMLSGKPILADKEVRFFNDPLWTRTINQIGLHNSLNNYYDIFPEISPALADGDLPVVTGDATPMYVSHPDSPYRALTGVPAAKILILVRDPVDRMYSEFWFRQLLKKSKSDLLASDQLMESSFVACARAEMARISACLPEESLRALNRSTVSGLYECVGSKTRASDTTHKCENPEVKEFCAGKASTLCSPHSVRNSMYVFQVFGWIEAFGRKNVMVMSSSEFYHNTVQSMERVTRFLGLEPFDWAPVTTSVFNIINPNSPSAKGRSPVNENPTSRGLTIGASSSSEAAGQYPPLGEEARNQLAPFFKPFNEALARLLGDSDFWDKE